MVDLAGESAAGFLETKREFLRIGVTGHRFLAELDRLRTAIDLGVQRLSEIAGGLQLHVMSSLAEGADRLVAERILARPGTKLTAVLAMPREMYVQDFQSAESKQEFAALLARACEVVDLPPKQNRDQCYEAAGEYILDHCDVLFALWDGHQAQGLGGTGALVAKARQKSFPLIWIHAGNRVPGGTSPTSLGAEQGKVSFEGIEALSQSISIETRRSG
jgi:hypothetical protein